MLKISFDRNQYSSQAWRVLVNRRITHWTIIELNALWLCELFEIERRRKRSLFCHLTVYFSFGLIFLFCNLNFERSCQFWESKVFFLWLAFALPHARLRAFSLPPFSRSCRSKFNFLILRDEYTQLSEWVWVRVCILCLFKKICATQNSINRFLSYNTLRSYSIAPSLPSHESLQFTTAIVIFTINMQ